MSPEDLADANLIESIREHARWQEPCEVVEENGVLLVAGANAFPVGFRNCAARVDPNVPAQAALALARDFFRQRRRGFAVLVRERRDADLESLLQSQRLKLRADSPCMLIEAPVPDVAPLPGIQVERFADERHVRDAVRINAEAYEAIGLPPQETSLYFNRPSALLSERIAGFVAYGDARPLSTALTLLSGAGAGVYWVGTVKDAERRGLGTTCTRLATNAGFARGVSVVTLQASPYGEPIYRRLGYRTYDRMRWYQQRAPE